MKNNTERDRIIFDLWRKGLTYTQISNMRIQSFLSLRRIRNIVYAGKDKLVSEHERKIYAIFRLKFLELQDVHEAILSTWENQPSHSLSEKHIRKIINKQLDKQRASLTTHN